MTIKRPVDDAPHEETPVPVPRIGVVQRPWFLALVLVIATVAAYQPTWHAGFIWDDDAHLTANPAVASPNGLKMIWSSLAVSRYYPLTLTTFWIEHRVWSLNPLPYHLVNIALHAANGVLVFFLLRRLRVPAAWLAAMVWALHPVNVESVAWVTEMKNTQSGLFFLLSVWTFLRFGESGRRRWYALALVCGLAALTSKPSTVVLPLVLLLCVWWKRGGWKRADILRIVPFFMLALGMSALTVVEQQRHIQVAGTAEWNLGMTARFVLAGKAVWFYASKLLWPARLTFVYPRWSADASSLWSWVPNAVLVALGVTLWRCRTRAWARAGLFGCGFFVLALLPVLGFFDVYYFRYSYVADHFQYLASIGLISLAASTGTRMCRRAGHWGRDWGTLAAAIVLLLLGASTWRQGQIYRDVDTLWHDTLTKNPQCWMAHTNLGNVLLQEGKISDAIGQYEQALRIKPDFAGTHSDLGIALAQTGKIEEAIAHYEQALRIKPDYAEVHYNLANVLLRSGKPSEAIAHYEQALRTEPDYAEAHSNLGIVLMQAGRFKEAMEHEEQALRIKPDFAEAHFNLGNVLFLEGKVGDAIGQYEQALRIKPDYAEAHHNLGIALEQVGRIKEAIAHYEQALRIKPDYAEAHNNLGVALLQLGRPQEAMGHWEQALQAKPDYAQAHYNLGVALAQAGRIPEAIEHLQQALRINPDLVQAQTALARLQAR